MKEEFDACGVPPEGRFGHMVDQIRACRVLWTDAPASINNKAAQFSEVFCFPQPFQKGGPRITLGIAPNERNFARMAEVADGWDCSPKECDPAMLRQQIRNLKQTFEAHGRDPSRVFVRAYPPIVRDANGIAEIKPTLAHASAFEDAGVDVLRINAVSFVKGDDFETFISDLSKAIGSAFVR